MMDQSQSPYQRYQRQILLKEFGMEGQQKLSETSVLVIGAGGLGCPALQYLVAAGVGKTGIADDDIVTISNLHRQILFTENDIGKQKAEVAAKRLRQLNSQVNIMPICQRITNQNALEIIADYDIVIDGTDNFTSRYLINDGCVLLDKPLIYGSIYKFEGQVAVFNVNGSANYRDLFPVPPSKGEVPSCDEAGVLGVLPGIIGTMQAAETIKLITGTGKPLIDSLLIYNSLSNQFYEIGISKSTEAGKLIPLSPESYREKDYVVDCGVADSRENEISPEQFTVMTDDKNIIIIDVREKGEQPQVTTFSHVHIPLSRLQKETDLYRDQTIITFCQSGIRSAEAARILSDGNNKVYSLKGGILNWLNTYKKEVTF